MNDIPSELKYSESHEWVRREDDGSFRVGITHHAQQLLGDMVYVELPEADVTVKTGDECAVVESVKAASDVYSPISGEVIAINETLSDEPGLINTDPYGAGWLFLVRAENESELEELMDAEEYGEQITEE